MPDFNKDSRYQAWFDNSADAILVIENNKFVDCNQAAVDMLSYTTKNSLLQCHPSELSPEYQPDGQRSFDKANRILANFQHCRSQRFEWDHVKSDGSLIPVEVSITAMNTGVDRSLHILWKDIGDRRQLANALRCKSPMSSLGNLAGKIAHELNNKLVPVLGYSELLGRELQNRPKLLHWSQEIGRAGILSAALAKNLLAVTRPQNPTPQIIDIAEVVGSTLDLLRKLVGDDIDLTFDRPEQALTIEFDEEQLEQILTNLAAYARDVLPDGGSVRIMLSAQDSHGRPHAQLEMTDNSPGMDADALAQMFVPFAPIKTLGFGPKIGLLTIYELVTRSNGFVTAKSAIGEGTTIKILLPIFTDKVIETDDATCRAEEQANGNEYENPDILVVEDNIQARQLTCEILEQAGYRVFAVCNGFEALETLNVFIPDLVLTDVVMPRMSGPSMVREIRARGLNVPVIFLSGYASDHLTPIDCDLISLPIVKKPFAADALLDQIRMTIASQLHT